MPGEIVTGPMNLRKNPRIPEAPTKASKTPASKIAPLKSFNVLKVKNRLRLAVWKTPDKYENIKEYEKKHI